MITYETAGEELLSLCDKEWLSKSDIMQIKSCIADCDSEMRLFIAENLINASPDDAWQLLKKLVKDPDYLVRAEACQSLSVNSSKDAFHLLLQVSCNDLSPIVRAYAIISVGEIINKQPKEDIQKAVELLESIEKTNKDVRIQLAICEVLYKMNPRKKYLVEIADRLDDFDYEIRCMALNHLAAIASGENREFLEKSILKLKQVESSEAVLSGILRVEDIFQNM